MYILGINSAYHESAACLCDDEGLVAAAEEERFTRVKHAKSATVDNPDELPLNALSFCLERAGLRGLDLSAIAHIGFSFSPDRRIEWHLEHRHPYPVASADFGGPDGERTFHRKCTEVPSLLHELGFRGQFHFIDHHVCHAASSFFVTPFEKAAVLVIDGIAEHESTSLFRGGRSELERIASIDYPHSLGFLWEKISTYLGFTEYDGAKIMALAAYGDRHRYAREFASFVSQTPFTVDDAVIRFRAPDYSGLEDLFKLDRRRQPLERVGSAERAYADVAAALQDVTERVVMALVERARDVDTRHLCLSGGVALNCATVGRILREAGFEDVYVPPAPHDAGTAIGASVYVRHVILGDGRRTSQLTPYLGPTFSGDAIEVALNDAGVTYTRLADGEMEEEAAKLLAEGHVVGWFQGAMEFGPRALGNRSLFADPRSTEVTKKLCNVKHRYEFDPFAPCVLEEYLADWFEVPTTRNWSSHYMSANYNVLPRRRGEIPAVLHIDGTSRVQAVSPSSAPRVYRLLQAFQRLTGTPVLLNTSFNDREPIVCTPADALRTSLRSGIDYLMIGACVVPIGQNVVATMVPDLPLEVYFEKLR